MNVVVSGSEKDDVAVFIGDEGIAYTSWNTADDTVAIDANGAGVTMKDTIVAYIDLAAGDTETANAPDGLKFIAVRGASTDTAPTDSAIDTVVGHSLWTRLADVSVSSGATSINSGNITDERVQAKVDGEMVELEDGSITSEKLNSTVAFSATVSGSHTVPEAEYFKYDFTVELFDEGGNYDTSNKRFTAPVDGVYFFEAGANLGTSNNRAFVMIYKNGVEVARGTDVDTPSARNAQVAHTIKLSAGDYIEAWGYRSSGTVAAGGGESANHFSGYLVGRT